MNISPGFSYDQVPYPGLSHARTHPDSLATLALLLGMHPAPVERCRVLELGCGPGSNLIPMAYNLPDSEFTGIDLAEGQIATGNRMITLLGLKNIRLNNMDIMEISADLGQFDYVIAHGVFSWVLPEVREKILEICRTNLAPQGVGFISYNTYPGWHMINIARGIMRFHTRKIQDPMERVKEARSVLRWFASASESETNGYYGYLKMYTNYLDGEQEDGDPKSDSALLHDELEELNQPFYFYEFVDRLEPHGLQYLGDLLHLSAGKHSSEKLEDLKKWSQSLIELEQSTDFLYNRTFRQTLVCHQEITINRKVTPARLQDFYLSSGVQAVSPNPDISGASVEQFRVHSGATFSTDHPLTKAAMVCLADAWPRPVKFSELASAARQRLGSKMTAGESQPTITPEESRILSINLLKAFDYSSDLVELHTYAPRISSGPGEKPVASQWAVLQAQEQGWVTNLRHERVELDVFDRFLLTHLDGSHDRNDLLDLLINGPVAEGVLTLETDKGPLSPQEQRALLAEEVELRLNWLAKAALFLNLPRSGD